MGVESGGVRAQVERLISSRTFETSEVHRRLLQYLTDKALAGEADRLKEYTIGLEAFSKPPSYDPKYDSIVRLQVGRLRQKLTAYYETEARDDTIRISLPKGGFKLSFEEITSKTLEGAAVPGWLRRNLTLVLAVALVLAVTWATLVTIWSVRARREATVLSQSWNRELEGLWEPFLETNRPVLVCLGTPLFIRIPEYGFFRDPKTNDWAEVEKSERITAVRKGLAGREILPWYAFTGAGEASAAFLVSRLLSTRKHDILLTRSNLMSWQQVADDDIVFIGPPKFNPQLQAAALKRDIVVEPGGIRNLRPRPGEPVYLEDRTDPSKPAEGETHALISRTAGLSGMGELLVLGGNASSDTFAAAEWLTQPKRAAELVRRLRDSSGRLPRHYQVVVKVVFKQGIPVESSYVFHHVME